MTWEVGRIEEVVGANARYSVVPGGGGGAKAKDEVGDER